MAYGDPLPEKITAKKIEKRSANKIRKLIRIYSLESVNARLAEKELDEKET